MVAEIGDIRILGGRGELEVCEMIKQTRGNVGTDESFERKFF